MSSASPPNPSTEEPTTEIGQQLAAQDLSGSMEDDEAPNNNTSLSRKRQLEEILQATTNETTVTKTPPESGKIPSNEGTAAASTTPKKKEDEDDTPPLDSIHRLRLEAIFHPKFENEAGEKLVRQSMKDHVHQDQGYLEVSLKHSGSLLLWSGGQRYYSKNSTDNVFTHAGEILLRQHFLRAYWDQYSSPSKEDDKNTPSFTEECYYHACSQYVEEQRLTLSFEVVTAVLGDHGDRPPRDFLILTAVADRSREQFYTTAQVVQLAQQFRLPHNDFWIFSTRDCVEQLFAFYDVSRETGLADTVIDTLNQAADTVVPSLYPHRDFQGNILEGIVIRYVANSTATNTATTSNNDQPGSTTTTTTTTTIASMESLSKTAKELCEKVPSSLPDCYELIHNRSSKKDDFPECLSTNLREVFFECRQKLTHGDESDSFADRVRELLGRTDRRKGTKLARERTAAVPALLRQLADLPHTHNDEETKRIVNVVEKLHTLNIRVDYAVIKEEIINRGFSRWLCIIHVILDHSHMKYRKNMKEGDMSLFRGFALELSNDKGFSANKRPHEVVSNTKVENQDAMELDEGEAVGAESPQPTLMLKMKFLPYMVRTFGCRNGLRSLKQGGVIGFMQYVNNLLSAKWKMSPKARKEWMPFFRAWAEYAEPRLANRLPEDGVDMPQLTSDCYLDHLQRFIPLYESGELGPQDGSGLYFQGFAIVVSPTQEKAKMAADYIAKKISCFERYTGSKVPSGTINGVVCSVTPGDKMARFKQLLNDRIGATFLIFFGCTDDDVEFLVDDEMDIKVTKGKLKSWRKLNVSRTFDLPLSDLKESDGSEGKKELLGSENMKKCTDVLLEEGSKDVLGLEPGILVFFPQIPGCGKSSLVNDDAKTELQSFLSTQTKVQRQVSVRMGDNTTGKFWNIVKKEKARDPSGVYLADKNVPAPSWDLVANVCAETNAIGVPVIPGNALRTTVVEGIRFPDGYLSMNRTHTFPFSLQYLAVCLIHILSREDGTHPGKLDACESRACMIVIMFFCMYQKVSADEFFASLAADFEANSAFLSREPIEIPFLREPGLSDLPAELTDVLVDAIRAQLGYSSAKTTKNKDVTKIKDPYLDELESRLRKTLNNHKDLLQTMTVPVEDSRKSFLEKIKESIEQADCDELTAALSGVEPDPKEREIWYVSLDISPNDVHNFLLKYSDDTRLETFWGNVAGNQNPSETLLGSQCTDNKFIQETHVTLAHKAETTQSAMKEIFGSIENHGIPVEVTALLWDDKTAALEVGLPQETNKGDPLPPSTNKFTHVTVWIQDGTRAFRSNELPDLVKEGNASRCTFQNPGKLDGKLIFQYT